MDEISTMSTKEINKLEVMQRLKSKRLRQKEAVELLGLSIRQVKRQYKTYRENGARGLVYKRRGQASTIG